MKALARVAPESPEPVGWLAWWLGELRDLLPGTRAGRARRRADLQLRLERPFVRVLGRRGSRLEPIGSFLLPELKPGGGPADLAAWGEPALRRALARHKSSTVLVLGPEDGLVCTDLLPASAESELARIVPHKLDLLTPWPADRVHAAYRVAARRPDGLLELLIGAAPRATVDELTRRLATLGIVPSAVDVAREEDGRPAELDLLQASAPPQRSRWLPLLLGLLVAAALATAGAAGFEAWRQHQALAEQQQLIDQLEQRLADLPALRERLNALQVEAGFLANERRGRPSPLIVFEVLSRLLPDSVWLSEIKLDNRELVLAGMAEDSSALIPLIERAPEFERVHFQTPSTRVQVRTNDGGGREFERFAISAEVDPSAESSL
ncbi:MAG: PilN domain-containing protein [Geminicoccaceae bacterium]